MTRLQIIFMTLTLRFLIFIARKQVRNVSDNEEFVSLLGASNDFAHLCNEHTSTLEAKKELEADNEV